MTVLAIITVARYLAEVIDRLRDEVTRALRRRKYDHAPCVHHARLPRGAGAGRELAQVVQLVDRGAGPKPNSS